MSSWYVAGASVLGSSHRVRNIANEDRFGAYTWPEHDMSVTVVADGHGGAEYVRAGTGAQFAVEILTAVLGAAAAQVRNNGAAAESALQTAVNSLIEQWRAAVQADVAAHPFTADEGAALAKDERAAWVAYGTTVLGAVATGQFVIVLAIGDGELGLVDSAGSHRDILPAPERIGVGTDSLASHDPHTRARTAIIPAADVAAVWLCTDGFSQAQADPQWRVLVARQLRDLMRDVGPERIADQLESWLVPAAESGGDDTTMTLLLALDRGRLR